MPGRALRTLTASAVVSLLLGGGALSGAAASAATVPAGAAASAGAAAGSGAAAPATHTLTLPDGSVLKWSDDGTATVTDKAGATKALPMPPSSGRSGLGLAYGPSQSALATRAADPTFALGSKTTTATTAQIGPMNTGAVTIPAANRTAMQHSLATAPAPSASQPGSVPGNAALAGSFDSYLNAQGVDAVGTFADDAKYLHALPGAGQIVTNVSIGDLTDASMESSNAYVREYGPTTIVQNGQRYLDIPTLPLIPTYTASDDGTLDPTGSTTNQDPNLGEVLLDFSMMAPLPDGDQRSGATGSGLSDLLGIAPGAGYRLVVPQNPTDQGINAALLAAANQQPRPSVITASLGIGTDEEIGTPGRYLEDDPTIRATLAKIVKTGIPVVISANDGTRLVLPVSVGPDGGATPTDVTSDPNAQTDINDDEPTTVPSELVDDGVIAAGATTTDDTLAGAGSATGTYPETRYDGGTDFASGFGSRVDLSAPGDNLPSLYRPAGFDSPPQAVEIVLNGGTSASAPEIAAAVADVLQAAKATGSKLSPAQVRRLLVDTARPVAQPPQADQDINVGPQLDVTRAVEQVLSKKFAIAPTAVRMSVAERQLLSTTGGTAFEEDTDTSAIDLAGPADAQGQPSGQNAVSPITFGLDMTGAGPDIGYRLLVGGHTITSAVPYVRMLPAELLSDAGRPVTSADSRTVTATMEAVRGHKVVDSMSRSLTFLADDGTYEQAQAPTVPGTAALGKPVAVSYDLTNVRGVSNPELVLSSVGHYTPAAGVDAFNAAWSTPLTALKGTVTIPASAFAKGGGGLYGVGLEIGTYDTAEGPLGVYGDFRAITVGPAADQRPGPVTLDGDQHAVDLTRAGPDVTVGWDVRDVAGATGAELEVGAPAPTLYNSVNTVTNANGTKPDDDGFNHPSTLTVKLSGVHGRQQLNLASLGLPTGLQYPVRVLALRGGSTAGQASPTSFVQYRDGDQVTGDIEDFTVSGGKALISTDTFGGANGYTLLDSALHPYDLASGSLGADLTDDTSGQTLGYNIGTDPSTGNALVLRTAFNGGQDQIDLVDATTGATVKAVPTTSLPGYVDYSPMTGATIDTQRHIGYVVLYDSQNGTNPVYAIDMATGAVTGPITISSGNAYRAFSNLTVDESTGDVFATTVGTQGPCLAGVAYMMVRIDPSAKTVSPAATLPACTGGVTADGDGGRLFVTAGPATQYYESATFPTGTFFTMDQGTLAQSAAVQLGTRGPAWPAYDAEHKLVVEASIYEQDIGTDNNAMSEITVLNPATGTVVEQLPVANIIDSTEADTNFDFTSDKGLYLDPSTRTGWIEDAWGTGLEQFHY